MMEHLGVKFALTLLLLHAELTELTLVKVEIYQQSMPMITLQAMHVVQEHVGLMAQHRLTA